jgi:thiol:disulfide interchange protein
MKLPQRHAHPHATRHGRAPWQGLVLLLGLWLATAVLAQDGLLRSYDDPFAAPGQPQFLPVEEAYPLAVAVDDAHTARLVWQMPPGYYLYQHAFKVTQLHDGAETALAPAFPPALEREDEYFGRVQVYYASAELTVTGAEPLAGTTLRVVSQGCADAGLCYPPRTQLFAVDADGSVREQALPNGAAAPARRESATASLATLASMALFAFGGGLILNLMPCVFPILSLKVLGFASAAPHERSRHGLFYGAGVILSFTLVALLLIALRGTGQAIGWGFQLQSPGFVITLAYLFTVMGLSLSGVVHFGGGLMNVGSSLAERSGAAGSFFTGVLAVVVASPCTAPFMGTALGFALTQATPIALAIFVALGAGMAAPMVLLSHSEAARRRMPAPGPWMDTLKEALAFPLYATALWLFWVAGRQAGVDLMAAALLGALLLALALWLWRAGTARRLLATACAVAAISLAFWRPPHEDGAGSALPADSVVYSPTQLRALRAEGRSVFVDVTADWCITCLANEKAVLHTATVQEAFRSSGVVYMVADWTDYDTDIAAFVAEHGRSGIPLYVLYSGASGSEPRLLPQLLRQSTLLEALQATRQESRQVALAGQNSR